jgi:hypothetical protein
MLATLADLLAPISSSEFIDAFCARRRLHIVASDRTRAETLFSWREIDTLLSVHGIDDNVKIMRDGVRVPRQLYTSNEGRRLNVRAFHDLLTQGVSVVVDDVARLIPQISQLATAIEREMGINTQVNAYLSFSKGGAFKPHWDLTDILVVQVHGNKRWRIWNTEVSQFVETDRTKVNTSVAPDQELELAAGDVLFIPRGEPHSAAVSAERSVHLTIGLLSETGMDFLEYLRRQAAKDPLFHMNLPRHSSNEQSAAHEAALKHRLHYLIDAVSVSQFLLEGDVLRLPELQTAVGETSLQMGDILRLTLRRRIPLPDVTPEGKPYPVTIGGEARSLSPASIDVLRWLFDHGPATLHALHAQLSARHGQGSIKTAMQELLRFGFLIVNRNG